MCLRLCGTIPLSYRKKWNPERVSDLLNATLKSVQVADFIELEKIVFYL